MPEAPEMSAGFVAFWDAVSDKFVPLLAPPNLPSQETPTNELSVQGPPEGDTDPSTPPAPPTPPHPATPGDGFPSNDSGFGEGRGGAGLGAGSMAPAVMGGACRGAGSDGRS